MLLVSFSDAPKVSDNLGIDVKFLCSRPTLTLTYSSATDGCLQRDGIWICMNGVFGHQLYGAHEPSYLMLAICIELNRLVPSLAVMKKASLHLCISASLHLCISWTTRHDKHEGFPAV